MSKLGVISDTHGFVEETMLAVDLFRSLDVQTVIHCGDIGGVDIIEAFRGLDTHFVWGNTDGECEILRAAAKETGNKLYGWFGSLERSGKRIAFLHGHQSLKFEETINSGNWDLVCYGHTHVASLTTQDSTILLNPGAFKRVFRPTIAVVTLADMTVERFDV